MPTRAGAIHSVDATCCSGNSNHLFAARPIDGNSVVESNRIRTRDSRVQFLPLYQPTIWSCEPNPPRLNHAYISLARSVQMPGLRGPLGTSPSRSLCELGDPSRAPGSPSPRARSVYSGTLHRPSPSLDFLRHTTDYFIIKYTCRKSSARFEAGE